MIFILKWLGGFFRIENIKAAIGSIKRRLLGWDYLEMRIDLGKQSVPAVGSLGKDVRIGGYSENIQTKCIDLLNSITSLGLWHNSNFQEILHSVDEPAKDIFVIYEKDYPVGFTVAHKKTLPDNSVEVGYIAVRPQSRGKQYGFKLLNHVISELKKRDISYIFLRSDSFRIPALKTYLKCGFVPYPRNENQKKRWQNVMNQININSNKSNIAMKNSNKLKIFFKSNKIHKLQLSNKFSELFSAFLSIIFRKLSFSAKAKDFEEAFRLHFGVKKSLIFPHARIAFHFILKSMNFEKGSEIIMAPLTIADMVNSIHTLGLKPVFVDIEGNSFCMDPQKLKNAITKKSKAILITYLFGVVPDISKIKAIADECGLKIIEDCSQCFDASYNGQKIGTFGDAAFFSLTNFKICSSLFGGMIIANNEQMANRLSELREKELLPAKKSMLLKLLAKDLIYTIFFSRWVFSYFTFFLVLFLESLNPRITYRLYSGNIKVLLGGFENKLYEKFPNDYLTEYTDIQAKVGLKSLERASYVTSLRTRNGERLKKMLEGLPQISLPAKLENAINVYWRFPIVSKDLQGLKKFLLSQGIDSSASYLTLCSTEPGFEIYHTFLPNAQRVKDNVLIVEVNESLSDKDIDFTASVVRRYFESR